jgi:hypothetical protein
MVESQPGAGEGFGLAHVLWQSARGESFGLREGGAAGPVGFAERESENSPERGCQAAGGARVRACVLPEASVSKAAGRPAARPR